MKEHWQIYKSLASDLRKRAKWRTVEKARQERFLEMAEFIETKPKFYVPDMSFVLNEEVKNIGRDKNNLVRLPYPETVILMDTIMKVPGSERWELKKELRGFTDDKAVLEYMDAGIEAQEASSHIPTVVLAKQQEGEDTIEFCAGVWNPHLKEWNPWAARALMYFGDTSFNLVLDSTDTATVQHVERTQDAVRDGAPEVLISQYKTGSLPILFLHLLLSLENVEVKKRGAPKLSIVGSRSQKKKRKSHKSFDYRVLSINGEVWDSPYESNNGGHGGVRSHLRRGHVRRFSNGKATWVRAAYIKGSKEGFIKKDYDVLGDKQ